MLESLIKFSLFTVLLMSLTSHSISAQKKGSALEGRWNMTIDDDENQYASWLEIKPWGYAKVGLFLHIGGYPRPISEIKVTEDKHFEFAVPWASEHEILVVKGTLNGDDLKGKIQYSDNKVLNWTAVRSPELAYHEDPEWGDPIELFNGDNLNGWHTNGENQWVVESGVLKSPQPGSNIISDQKFNDFKLHIEFRFPKNGNSGVYLRGRYELQICDSKGKVPSSDQFGSIFGFLEPNQMVDRGPGEWQSFDVILIGRRVTVKANGHTIFCDQRIPAITGGALNSNENQPGPIMLQGDHDPIEYRNIVLTPRVIKKD